MNPRASEQMKTHWARCRLIANMLDIQKTDANKHWTCCLKAAWGDVTWAGTIPAEAATRLHQAHAACLLRTANAEREIDEWRASRHRSAWTKTKTKTKPAEPPDLTGRIKIMLWAIDTCGSVEKAEDALERAKRSLASE